MHFESGCVSRRRKEGQGGGLGKLPDAKREQWARSIWDKIGSEWLECQTRHPQCFPGEDLALWSWSGSWGGQRQGREFGKEPPPLPRLASFLPVPSPQDTHLTNKETGN